jgi:hypothetical protein
MKYALTALALWPVGVLLAVVCYLLMFEPWLEPVTSSL